MQTRESLFDIVHSARPASTATGAVAKRMVSSGKTQSSGSRSNNSGRRAIAALTEKKQPRLIARWVCSASLSHQCSVGNRPPYRVKGQQVDARRVVRPEGKEWLGHDTPPNHRRAPRLASSRLRSS